MLVDLPRQRWWAASTAHKYFKSQGRLLPAEWEPVEFTTAPSGTVDDAEMSRALRDVSSFVLEKPFVRLAPCVAPCHLAELGECGDILCNTYLRPG